MRNASDRDGAKPPKRQQEDGLGRCATPVPHSIILCQASGDDMTQLDIASQDVAALETAPTRYIQGHEIRFAYRRLGPAIGTPLVLLQHFSGNIDAWDPAVVNALATDRPVIAFDNAGVGARLAKRLTISQRWREMQSPSLICSAFLRTICWLFSRRLYRPTDRRRARTAGPEAHPRRHRTERRRGTPVSRSAAGVFPNRCARPPPAAVLHEFVRQPVVRLGLPEADESA
jgi:hypothetical protein